MRRSMLPRRVLYVLIAMLAILLFVFNLGPLARPRSELDSEPPLAEKQSYSSPHPVTSRTFLLLKTGIEVAYTRLPAHISSTLNTFPHHAVYADEATVIDNTPIIDALSFLDEDTLNGPALQAYRLRRQSQAENWHWDAQKISLPREPDSGWRLDRFKNVPAFAHAYVNHPDFDWYVMIDADSYILASTLQEVVRDKDPNGVFYLGKGVGPDRDRFAHGGSGIVFSRGALAKMFGDTVDSAEVIVNNGGRASISVCCGDISLARTFSRSAHTSTNYHLQINEVGQFQGDPIWRTHVVFSEWCNAVGTFHQIQPWEVERLYNWEVSTGSKRVTYADFYEEFIMPEVVPEKRNWYLDYSNTGIDASLFDTEEAQNKDLCIKACEKDDECTMWLFTGNDACVTFRNSVGQGMAMNEFSPNWNDDWTESTLGYMVERIQNFRKTQECDNQLSGKKEGWRYAMNNPGEFYLKHTPIKKRESITHDP